MELLTKIFEATIEFQSNIPQTKEGVADALDAINELLEEAKGMHQDPVIDGDCEDGDSPPEGVDLLVERVSFVSARIMRNLGANIDMSEFINRFVNALNEISNN
jgi:hypothetical protein